MNQVEQPVRAGTSLNSFALTQIYCGLLFTLTTTLLMTLGSFFFVMNIGIFEIGVETTFGLSRHSGQIVSNTLEILFLLGWLQVVSGTSKLIGKSKGNTSLKLLYWCSIVLILAALHEYFLIFNIYHTALVPLNTVVRLASVLPTLAFYPLQLLVIRTLAREFANSKVDKQTHIWMWLTPMLLVATATPVLALHENFFWILIVVLLIVTIQYWNMLELVRRDVKKRLLPSTV